MGDAVMERAGMGQASRSIGEILDDLRGDFPDISVSKIRFLESQGLITPLRTPSGYRQFSEDDLDLLRWILRLQRDHYLPLKVIRRRLKEGDGPGREAEVATETNAGHGSEAGPQTPPGPATPHRTAAATVAVDEARLRLPDPVPEEADVWFVTAEDPATAPAPARADGLWTADPPLRYSRRDVGLQAGLDDAAMGQLESFGLLPAEGPEGYDAEALRIAGVCAGFFSFGVEARHLRMYKTFAEREAAFLGQVVMPVATGKDPGAAARAAQSLAELARLGAALRLSMLRVGIGPPPGG